MKKAVDLIPEVDPVELIKDYEKNFKTSVKKAYDIVYEKKI